MPPAARRYLFLQGPVGPFAHELGAALRDAGAAVHRINFNGGDRLYWRLPDARDYRGDAAGWPAYFEQCLAQWRITDLVLFGDCRPLHRAAIEHPASRELRVHVFEEGYFRPGWITLEAGGVNGYSSLPTEPQAWVDLARVAPALPTAAAPAMSFARRAAEDVLYTTATALLRGRYPGYRTHKPWSPLAEYRAGTRRFFARPRYRADAARIAAHLLAQQRRFFLFPLQLDSDAQIRVHSPFGRMQPAIEAVIRSFATHAPADALLVVSEHPLDQGVVDLGPIVERCAAEAAVAARVVYLRGGTPPPLVAASQGVVTINSTVGLSALVAGRPLAVLGDAVYRVPGLVHAGPIDTFWTGAQPPDAVLFAAFRRVLVARTQLPGGYYGPAARRRALEGAVPRLLANGWTASGLLLDTIVESMPEACVACEGLTEIE